MRWEHGGLTWIGEVELTRYLSVGEAFRAALGQLLVYRATHFSEAPGMVMFLDQSQERLMQLAERLEVAVVVEASLGVFELRLRHWIPTWLECSPAATGPVTTLGGAPDP